MPGGTTCASAWLALSMLRRRGKTRRDGFQATTRTQTKACKNRNSTWSLMLREFQSHAPQLVFNTILYCKAYATSQGSETSFNVNGETLGIQHTRLKLHPRLGTIYLSNNIFYLALRSQEIPLYSRFSRGS